MLQYLHIL